MKLDNKRKKKCKLKIVKNKIALEMDQQSMLLADSYLMFLEHSRF